MRRKATHMFPWCFLLLVCFAGCLIEEAEGPATGFVYVSAHNQNGVMLVGGKIYVDGIEQAVTTPDTVTNVLVGERLIRVKVQGFSAKDESVLVEKNNITFATFILDTADYGYLSFNLTPTEAKLVLDRVLLDPTPSFPLETETGIHSASAFLV